MTTRHDRAYLLLPALLVMLLVVGVPILRVVELSVTQTRLEEGVVFEWGGLRNYARVWQDSRFWTSLRNTLVFTSASVLAEMVLGVGIALVLDRRFRGRSLLRAAVLVPWALPTAVIALAWAWVFNDAFGVANDLLRRVGLLEQPVAWLGDPVLAMGALVVADVWKTTPFVALIVLAGLQAVPSDLVDAARVDGLNAAQRFRYVVLPLLIPSLLVAALFRAVQAYGAFDLVYVMTGGGPGGATETVSLYAYQNYFRYLDFSYGSTVAVMAVALATTGSVLVLRLARHGADR
ncbi:MAG: carbohydrate ABC transporter permease [Vicinamibacterales bacterium]